MILHTYRVLLDHLPTLVSVIAAVVVFMTFVRWERQGRGIRAVFAILGVLLIDATLYPSTEAMQLHGIFHPFVAGQSIRLVQALIALALVARLLGRGLPARVGATGALWSAFFAWYLTAAVVGMMQGHNQQLVTSRGMLVLEAGGFALLVAGVPVRDYLAERGLPWLIAFGGVLATANFAMAEAGTRISASLPRLPLLDFGQMGADAATLFPTLGFIGLAMELTRSRRRLYVVVASVMLLIAPLASIQRAARLGIAVTVVVFLCALLWPRRRRFHARGGDWILVGSIVAVAVAAPIFAHSVAGDRPPSVLATLPLADKTSQAVSSDFRQGSVQSRYNEWRAAEPLIRDSPVFGHGLGTVFQHYEVGTAEYVDFDLTNNIGLDLLVRTGAVGLALFAAAFAATLGSAWRVFRRARSDIVSLVGVMTLALLVGYVAKGMVESVLNEYHLAPLLGFLVGLVGALAAGRGDADAGSPAPRAIEGGAR